MTGKYLWVIRFFFPFFVSRNAKWNINILISMGWNCIMSQRPLLNLVEPLFSLPRQRLKIYSFPKTPPEKPLIDNSSFAPKLGLWKIDKLSIILRLIDDRFYFEVGSQILSNYLVLWYYKFPISDTPLQWLDSCQFSFVNTASMIAGFDHHLFRYVACYLLALLWCDCLTRIIDFSGTVPSFHGV